MTLNPEGVELLKLGFLSFVGPDRYLGEEYNQFNTIDPSSVGVTK